MTAPLELMGAPGSPYTRKMVALLRYRRILYQVSWSAGRPPKPGYPVPKVPLLPTFYYPDEEGGMMAVTDSTPITRRLESEYAGRSVLPSDPVLSFLNDLIEDYADEWLTKAMFHFRWAHQADYDNAGPLLIYWSQNTLDAENAGKVSDAISKRQFDRLYVVGSNDVTAKTIESSYARLIGILDELLQKKGFVLGGRPSSADFAIFGQLTQLAIVEPTSAAITVARSPRVRAWVDLMEDLSGLDPQEDGWFGADEAREALAPLLTEIGRVYAPFLIANAGAIMVGEKSFETEIDGHAWTQPSFPYQAKCLKWLREGYEALSGNERGSVGALLSGTGCETLFD
ncbi:MAG: glutathione S-transferase [Hyphomonas sp.]|jgi:glutathione S-transferase